MARLQFHSLLLLFFLYDVTVSALTYLHRFLVASWCTTFMGGGDVSQILDHFLCVFRFPCSRLASIICTYYTFFSFIIHVTPCELLNTCGLCVDSNKTKPMYSKSQIQIESRIGGLLLLDKNEGEHSCCKRPKSRIFVPNMLRH